MENYTQLGIAGLALGIIFFIIRYFVDAQKEERKINIGMTEKVTKALERNAASHEKLKISIDANTQATRQSTDNLSKLMLELIKAKELTIKK